MKRLTGVMVCLLAAGLTAGVAGCGKKEKAGAERSAPPVIAGVVLEEVTAGAIPDQIEAVGTIRAKNAALLAARIPASVTAVHVREGERVAKGKLLVSLESTEAASGAASSQAAVDEALRGLDEALSRRKLAEVTFERYDKLFREQAVTRQEMDVRRTERETAEQGVARAEARLVQAREGAKAAGAVAGYARITAPLAGVVTSKPVETGMTVFPGTPLVTVEEEGNYRLEVDAPETLAGKVRTGDRVACTIDGIDGETAGRVADVVPAVDPASRTFTVKIAVAAKGLRSGSYGRALFPVGVRPGFSVPKSAVVERGPLTSVWVVGTDGIARMRLVKTGRDLGGKVEILAGLSAGERVVTSGVEKVTDGAKVNQQTVVPQANTEKN